MFETPILLITFNRPKHTEQVWNEIKKQKPKYIFVFQDGARENNEKDKEKCEIVRAIFHDTIDWECELKTYFSNINLGCGTGPATAITWFFDNVEQGIIFEDDCLPSQSLFRFYEELLFKYKDDNRISLITGTNLKSKWKSYRSDYFFCKTGGATMGSWASWRRYWKIFDYDIKSWGEEKNKVRLKKYIGNRYYKTFSKDLDMFYNNGQTHSWDYQWVYARLLNRTLSIVSSVNQMSNIGFGDEATHTYDHKDKRANIQRFFLKFPFRGTSVKADKLFDFMIYYRFSDKNKKNIFLKVLLKSIESFYCK